MSTLRFALVVAGLFGLTFVGASWARMGFPVLTFVVSPLKPNPNLPTFEQATQRAHQQEWMNSKTNSSDGDPKRDKLRLDLLEASNAYKMSPCDDTMKKNLVAAMTSYVTAWSDMAFCKPGVDGCSTSYDQRLDTAAATFKTPADLNMHQVLRQAIDQGGISREDFPAAIRRHVFLMSGAPSPEPKAACHAAHSVANRQ